MKRLTVALGAFALFALVGCNKETTPGVTDPKGDKALKMTFTKEVDLRVADEAKDFKVSVEKKGFDEDVTISITDLPAGVEVTEKDTKITKGQKEATFHLRATDSAKPAEGGSFKVAAKAAGMTDGPHSVKLDIAEKKAGATATPPSGDAAKKREDFKKQTRAKIDAANASITALEKHANTASGDAKTAIDKEIADLKQRRDNLEKDLARADETKPDAWDKFVEGVNKAADDLKDAAQKAADKIKK